MTWAALNAAPPFRKKGVKRMRKTVRTGFWFFGMAVLVMLAAALYWQAALPDEYTVTRDSSLSLHGNIPAVFEKGRIKAHGYYTFA